MRCLEDTGGDPSDPGVDSDPETDSGFSTLPYYLTEDAFTPQMD
jgi:hypothetical protein